MFAMFNPKYLEEHLEKKIKKKECAMFEIENHKNKN